MVASVLDKIHELEVRDVRMAYRYVQTQGPRRMLGLYVVHDPLAAERITMVGELKVPFMRTVANWEPDSGRIGLNAAPPIWFSHQFYTEPGLARFSNLYMPAELAGRARTLERYAEEGHRLAEMLSTYTKLLADQQQWVQSRLRVMGSELLRRFDPFHKDAGKHFLLASDVTDALGRLNPQAMALKVEASAKRVGVPLEQVRRNQLSIQKLQTAVEEIRQMRDSALAHIWRILEQKPTRKLADQMRKDLASALAIKPFCFPANFALHTLGQDPLPDDSFVLIRRAFFAELGLIQYDTLLAEIEDDHRLFGRRQIELASVLGEVNRLEVPPYVQLGRQLGGDYRQLRGAMMNTEPTRKAKEFTEILARSRRLIRYRSDPVWVAPRLRQKYLAA